MRTIIVVRVLIAAAAVMVMIAAALTWAGGAYAGPNSPHSYRPVLRPVCVPVRTTWPLPVDTAPADVGGGLRLIEGGQS